MQKSRENAQSLGICQRLFNLIMNSLFARGLKRVTLGHPAPPEKGNSEVPESTETERSEGSGSEIQVRFKQTEDEEYWDFWKVEKDDQMDSASESSKQTKKKHRKKVSIGIKEAKPKGSTHRHLFSVASNINEKSEAFIRHRKEDMINAS